MTLKELFEKVESSAEFRNFKKKSPKAYFSAAFFVFDYDTNTATKQIDYWDGHDVMTFLVDDEKIISKKEETVNHEKMPEIAKESIKVDVDKAIEKAKDELKKLKRTPAKIIAILQTLNNEVIWNLTCISGFEILRMHVTMDGKADVKKSSLLEMMRIEKGNKGKEKTNYIG